MALSSLSAQLAALGGGDGSAVPSSRSHSQAVGRGMHFSTKHGHGVHVPGSKFVPTVLGDDARSASDVPMTTLQINAEESAAKLYRSTGNAMFDVRGEVCGELIGRKSAEFERGLQTKARNAEIDAMLGKLLAVLGTVLDGGVPAPSSAAGIAPFLSQAGAGAGEDAPLHILEYLLRRYQVHVRLPQQLLLCALPYHETRLFARILRLVDLASIGSWAFLRPYAATASAIAAAAAADTKKKKRRLDRDEDVDVPDLEEGAEAVPRGVIAKWAARDDAVAAALAGLARGAAAAHASEARARGGVDADAGALVGFSFAPSNVGGGASGVRRGVSRIVSFVAAALTEAMDLQTKDRTNAGSLKESTVRVLLPFVLGACGGDADSESNAGKGGKPKKGSKTKSGGKSLGDVCPDYRSYGHILAAALASACPALSAEAREVLATTIVRGGSSAGGGDDGLADAALTVLSVLVHSNSGSGSSGGGGEKSSRSFLPSIKSKGGRRAGVDLPPTTFRSLKSCRASLPAALGRLADEDVDVSPLVAAMAAAAIGEIVGGGDSGKKAAWGESADLVKGLIEEPSLRHIWVDADDEPGLAAPTASALIVSYASRDGDDDSGGGESKNDSRRRLGLCRSVLAALRKVGGEGTDAGIAHAVGKVGGSGGKKKGRKAERAAKVAALLESSSRPFDSKGDRKVKKKRSASDGSDKMDVDEADGAADEDDDAELSRLLPPRVALEHPDATVRLGAVKKMYGYGKGSRKHSMDVDDDDDEDGVSKAETIALSLLRRVVHDEDASVVEAACGAVCHLTNKGNVDLAEIFGEDEGDDDGALALGVLAALHRWGDRSHHKKPKVNANDASKGGAGRARAFNSLLELAGYVAKALLPSPTADGDDGFEEEDPHAAFDGLIHVVVANLDTAHGAAAVLRIAGRKVGGKKEPKKVEIIELAAACVADSECDAFRGARQRAARAIEEGGEIDEAGEKSRSKFLWAAFEASGGTCVSAGLAVLHSHSEKAAVDDAAAAKLAESFEKALTNGGATADDRVSLLAEAASVLSVETFDKAVAPAIRAAGLDAAVLMEAASRNDAGPIAVERLVAEATKTIVASEDGGEETTEGARKDEEVPPAGLVVHTLALLRHPSRPVREGTIAFLSRLGPSLSSRADRASQVAAELCALASDDASALKSSLLMDGAGTLPRLLAEAAAKLSPSSSGGGDAAEVLLSGCVDAAVTAGRARLAVGGSAAAAAVLSAMDAAGEEAYPLRLRWELAGRPVFNALKAYQAVPEEFRRLADCVILMLKGVISDKGSSSSGGTVITTGPSSGNGRSRSYSVGAATETAFLSPYPEDMAKAITECFGDENADDDDTPGLDGEYFVHGVLPVIIRLVIVRPSWAEGVFPTLKDSTRRDIAAGLLALRSRNDELSGQALLGLPLTASDFASLLSRESGLLELTFLADCIGGRSAALAAGAGGDAPKVAALLFEKLRALSLEASAAGTNVADDTSSTEYARSCLLRTLLKLHEDMGDAATVPDTAAGLGRKFSSHATLLVALIGGGDGGSKSDENDKKLANIKPLASGRSRAAALALLAKLSALAPGAVATSLVPATTSAIASATSSSVEKRAAGDALAAVVAAYCSNGGSGSGTASFADLLETFCRAASTVAAGEGDAPRERRLVLHSRFTSALLAVPSSSDDDGGDAVASYLALCMATEARAPPPPPSDAEEASEADSVSFYGQVLQGVPAADQVAASLRLLRYAGEVIETVGGGAEGGKESQQPTNEGMDSFFRVTTAEIASVVSEGADGKKKKKSKARCSEDLRALMRLATDIIALVYDGLSSPAMKKIIRNSEGADANACLQIWQELLQMQTISVRLRSKAAANKPAKGADSGAVHEAAQFWEATPSSIGDCLELLQRLLPVPHFLASVASVFREDSVDGALLVRAAQLLSDRVSETDPNGAEASLYLDIVPDLVGMLPDGGGDGRRPPALVQQASLMAIERLASSLCLSLRNPKLVKSRASAFVPAMERVTGLLNHLAGEVADAMRDEEGNMASSETADSQVLSTAALCASALINALKVRCLPQLSKLLKPLLASLSTTNSVLATSHEKGDEDRGGGAYQSAKLLQLSTVRTLLSVVEHLPQFVPPYLGQLLAPGVLPSRALRGGELDDDLHVVRMTDRLDAALATNIPVRQLIPAAARAVSECSKLTDGGCGETRAVLSIMKTSVQKSSRAELSPVAGKLLNAVTRVFGFDGDANERVNLLSAANETLLALVMKLSEAQLRPLYARLREWRGELAEAGSEKGAAARRYAFWSFSALLSIQLRSIALPCLGSVVGDIASELEFAVTSLCCSARKVHGGKKRRKLEGKDDAVDTEVLAPLQPLLYCLESALKADAHDGGGWIRSDEGERYSAILEPLGKLLQAKIPHDFPLASNLGSKEAASTTSFQMLVQGVGTEDYGSVTGCFTALAAAAGNEQLWKPLNHAILEACSNEERSEVRRAGVGCLLSVIQSLGEEYMVLLPECLPILSELLEDSDEDIAALAKECITQGEELLGESLDDAIS